MKSSLRSVIVGITGVGIGIGLSSTFNNRRNLPVIPEPVTKAPSTSIVSPKDFFNFGFPGPIHDLQFREEFISSYDRRTKNPYWVLEHLTPESLNGRNADRKNSKFMEDEDIPEIFRAKLKDYFRSGYDRGHQAAAANAKFSQQAMDDTFYLTNMSPQVGQGFNRDYWAHFEYFCRNLTKKFNNVYVITGPLYLPKKDPKDGKFKVTYEMIGNPPNVAVPTHFFKLIVTNDKANGKDVSVGAFILPNEPISNEVKLTDFEVPLDALERASGLELLQKIPISKRKELCKEINCHIVVRDFSQKALNKPKDKN